MGADLSPKPTDINWSGEYDMRKLPRISRTGFDIAVHYAVAVMKKSVYHDEKKTLSQKMLSARLWEHRGGDAAELMELGDARGLELEDLETIYAIEEVGDTKYSNKEISEKCKSSRLVFCAECVQAKCQISLSETYVKVEIFPPLVELP
jgi:hypothetical protein